VTNVQDFDGFGRDAVKQPVRITNKWDGSDARALFDFWRTLRPLSDAALDGMKPSKERRSHGRIVRTNEFQNFVEIA
jgi:hypothetical protein